MAKLASKGSASAKPASKLAAPAKGAAKPAKAALAKPAKTKAPAPAKFAVNDVVEFIAYSSREDGAEAIFSPEDRLVITLVGKDKDGGGVFYQAVKEEDHAAFLEDPESVTGDEVVPAEIKKAAAREVDLFEMEVVDDTTLTKLLEENDGDALATALALQEAAVRSEFYLGGALQHLYAGRAYLEFGENDEYADDLNEDGTVVKSSGWDKFCREHFNESGRKCFDLVQTYRAVIKTDLTAEEIADLASDKKVGYVKLAMARNVITTENVRDIIELARGSNVTDFRDTINTDYKTDASGEARSGGASAKITRTKVVLNFFADSGAAVDFVLKTAAKQMSIPENELSKVVERIVMQWAAENLGEPTIKKAVSARKKVLKDAKAKGIDVSERVAEGDATDEWLENALNGEAEEAEAATE